MARWENEVEPLIAYPKSKAWEKLLLQAILESFLQTSSPNYKQP